MVTFGAEAVSVMGISQSAMRRRNERGHLSGRNVDGPWQELLTSAETTEHDASHASPSNHAPGALRVSHDQPETHHSNTGRSPVVSATAQAQLEAFRDSILRPHLERIEELAKQVGQLTAERDAAHTARIQAEQRLASDRALLDLVAADMERSRTMLTGRA